MFCKKIYILLIIFNFTLSVNGTNNGYKSINKPERKIIYGLYFDEMFYIGYKQTRFTFFPFAVYRINERIWLGGGGKYKYYNSPAIKSNVWGASAFANSMIFSIHNSILPVTIAAHAEYQLLNIPPLDNNKARDNLNLFFLGGGLRQKLSENSYFLFMILKNIHQENRYPERIEFRLGFTF